MKKPPFIKLYVKDFAFDIQDLSNGELGAYMRDFLKAYKTGKISKKNEDEKLFFELKKSIDNYDAVCKRNKNNRVKTKASNNDSSTTGQRVDDDSFNHEPLTINHELDIPPIIPQGIWDEWVRYRKEKKKTLTKSTIAKQIKQLTKWHDEGHDVTEIINQSIMNGWVGLFKPKGENNAQKSTFSTARDEVLAEYGIQNTADNSIDRPMLCDTGHIWEDTRAIENFNEGYD